MDCASKTKIKKFPRCRAKRVAGPSAFNVKRSRSGQAPKLKRCICTPNDCKIVDFPAVWSELRASEQLCDGRIKCAGERVFYVHRALLSAVSPYFKVLFTNTLKGTKSESSEVSIGSVPGDLFELILDYTYTGKCNVTAENVERLLPLADQLEVLGVVQLCCRFLLQELRPENCLGIYKFARHYFCRNLEEKGRRFVRQNFKRILNESGEFKDLGFEELRAILQDDELNAKKEELVFWAIKKWIDHQPEARKRYLPNLLKCVRFGLLSYKFFTEISSWELVREDKKCLEILSSARTYLLERDARQTGEVDSQNLLLRPRIPHEILFAIGGWSSGSPTTFVETYDTRADRWFPTVNTDVTPRAYHGVCVLDNLVYVIGGYDGQEHFNTVRCFDPVTKKWYERACMYHARCYVSVCTHGGKIYALGGYNGRTRMSSGERYDPRKNQWEMIPAMHQQRSDASAATLKDKIYVVGGFNGQEIFASVEVFDVETNQWSYVHSMLKPRTGVSLVTFRDSLYALGGFSGSLRYSSGECYNPAESDSWREIAEMYTPRSNFAAVILDDMIYVIGGFDGFMTIAYVECYDADNNEWYEASSMNLNRSAFSACVLSGLPNARDYSYLGKTRDLGQGQATSKNEGEGDEAREGGSDSNVRLAENQSENWYPSVAPINGMAEGWNNYHQNE